MNFSENLQELMFRHGYTQAVVAKAVGVSQRAVSKWLRTESEPTATNLYRLAKFFDVSSDFLLGLREDY